MPDFVLVSWISEPPRETHLFHQLTRTGKCGHHTPSRYHPLSGHQAPLWREKRGVSQIYLDNGIFFQEVSPFHRAHAHQVVHARLYYRSHILKQHTLCLCLRSTRCFPGRAAKPPACHTLVVLCTVAAVPVLDAVTHRTAYYFMNGRTNSTSNLRAIVIHCKQRGKPWLSLHAWCLTAQQ